MFKYFTYPKDQPTTLFNLLIIMPQFFCYGIIVTFFKRAFRFGYTNNIHKYKKLKSCTYFCLHSCTKGSWAWTLSKTTLTFTASQSITWNETGQNYLLVGAWLTSSDQGWSRVKNTKTWLSTSTKLLVRKFYSKLNSTRRVTVKTCKKQYKVNLSFVEV